VTSPFILPELEQSMRSESQVAPPRMGSALSCATTKSQSEKSLANDKLRAKPLDPVPRPNGRIPVPLRVQGRR
jgi:hypothetical protein